MTSEAIAITYGLTSAITWGAGDFSGGWASRRNSVLTVIVVSQVIGALALVALGFLFLEPLPATPTLAWGGAAGICGVIGLTAFYKGLASGRMGVVAPLSAVLTAMLPVCFAFFTEGLPRLTQISEFAVALLSVWFLSAPESSSRIQKDEFGLAMVAGMGFGLFFICIGHVSHQGIFWPLVAARTASISMMAMVLFIKKTRFIPPGNQIPCIALAGILDAAGNAFFALAAHTGRLDVSAVLASLYPATTVMLAWFLLKERLKGQQWVGVGAAVVALVLISK
ncbi:MAG: DMT family transporter [Desulfobacterales bacterium]|nr:DMT family transporter [Desulfobacterales bacterium]